MELVASLAGTGWGLQPGRSPLDRGRRPLLLLRGQLTSRIPAVVCIDVEPDPRSLDQARPSPWHGFERLQAAVPRLRRVLAERTGAPVHLSWFLRMDPQVALTYGSPTWAAVTYARFIEGARAEGDEIGIHPHAYRWDEAGHAWVSDHGDPRWVEHCLRTSVAAFREAFGERCLSGRIGDHWMSDSAVRVLEESGVRFDLTLEPGVPAAPSLLPGERSTGSLPDLTVVPRRPYRPSLDDFRRPDPGRPVGLWMLPVTTGRPGPLLRRLRRLYYRLAGRELSTDVIPLSLVLRPTLFRRILSAAIAAPDERPLVLVARTDIGSRPGDMRRLDVNVRHLGRYADRLLFVTPREAANRLGLT